MRRTALAVAVAFVLGGFSQRALAEKQPKMEEALVHLRYALAALKSASHDKGGHRAKAVELTEKALDEVNKGIAFDNKR
jgi:predicted component of type VI protein secretion system